MVTGEKIEKEIDTEIIPIRAIHFLLFLCRSLFVYLCYREKRIRHGCNI